MEESSVTVVAKSSTTVASVSGNALDPYLSFLHKSNNIDVSFSSYLKRSEEEQEEAEISIFDARKYFSEGANDQGQKDPINPPRFSSASSANVSSCSRSNFQVGHTASSEVSWNSQTGLLSNLHDTNGVSNRDKRETKKKGSSLGAKWLFRRKASCPCSSKKSVQVQENNPSRASEPKSDNSSPNPLVQVNINSISLNQNNPSRPITGIIHQVISSDPIRLTIPPNPVVQERIFGQKTRDSGGFTFPVLNPQSSEPMIEPVVNPVSPKDEEAVSDASSDLFELESFSTQTTSHAGTTRAANLRESLDKTLTETTTEYGYEPSEASVTWSVTTAEPAASIGVSSFPEPSACSKRKSSGGGGLFSCRCESAVAVSGSHRPVAPKSVSVPHAVGEKVLHDNGVSKLSIINR